MSQQYLSTFKVVIAIEKLERYKTPGFDQILADLIQSVGKTLVLKYINTLIIYKTPGFNQIVADLIQP
jgi:hypothetical protein